MLEIIGAGFGRTGTLSLKAALERLGYGPCHHMQEVFSHQETISHWERAARGESVDWQEIYSQYKSTVDWPGSRFWRELADFYPSARVILTTRDPQRWYESAFNSIYQGVLAQPPRKVQEDARLTRIKNLTKSVVWDGIFDGRFADEGHAKKIFTQHNDEVCREIPVSRLLVFDISQGWGPLCDFLGVPVPAEPFPQLNDRKAFSTGSGSGLGGPREVNRDRGAENR
ncbi:sulfotransferase family protein [Streptomyces hyaluromycini]|uniref:sulfotransferase family protein n=1 Tax=Streptomyces hyaluromycini TaxID=1377993 RepID=UPI001237DBFE|nr:sulfotransferase family protein [Streptomyces hyaluromycini]